MNRGGQQRLRFVRAYWVTIVVIASYVWLRVLGSFRGEAWMQKAIGPIHVRNARRIQRTIVRLQGLFIKVGQLISILTNFLPPEFRRELEGLQDSVPPRPFADIEARFLDEFKQRPREVFAEFDEVAVAAASISQVHVARLRTGERVAVKVQYPDIDAMVRSDLETFRGILWLCGLVAPTHGFDTVYREVAQMLVAELDFEAEAKNIELIGKNLARAGVRGVALPQVFQAHSTRRVLTTGFVDGKKATDLAALEALGVDRRDVARRLVEVYCQQIFIDGYYHADPHPGNVLVDASGTITLLDFGAVATIRPEFRKGMADFLQAVLNQSTERIAQALRDMGFVQRGPQHEEVLERVVAYFHERFQESITLESFNLKDIKVDPERGLEHLFALRQMDIGIGDLGDSFQIPRDWILLERTVLMLTGLCTHLDPDIRPMDLIRPYLKQFVLGEGVDWQDFVVSTGKELGMQLLGLPTELRKMLARASSGRLEVRVRGHKDLGRTLYVLGHQVIYTLVVITSVSLGTVLHLRGEPELRDLALRFAWGGGALLLFSMWRHGHRPRS